MRNVAASLLFLALFSFAGCKTPPVEKIDPKGAYGMILNEFAVVIDVREEKEIKATGMAQQARWIPFSKIEKNAPEWVEFKKGLSRDKQAIFYCAGGGRAQIAAEDATRDGIRSFNMGGFSDWKTAGLPVKQLTP